MTLIDWRFQGLLEMLEMRENTRRRGKRQDQIIAELSRALPKELVELAHRLTRMKKGAKS